MPALAHPPLPSVASSEAMASSVMPLSFDALVNDAGLTQASELASSARRAVDSAMAAADQFALKGEHRGVNLQFSFSGVDVAVRVEMRRDGVHTTFLTDSPEMRSALAQEWQSVVSTQPMERSPRLAEPVFTSNPAGSSTSTDAGASQQRESHARQSQGESGNTFAPSSSSRASEAVASGEPVRVRSVRPDTTRHLDAVA